MLPSVVESAPLLPSPNPFLAFCLFILIMALLFVTSSAGAKLPGAPLDERGGARGGVETEAHTGDGDGGGVDAGGCRVIPEAATPGGNDDICQTATEDATDGGGCEELNRRVEEFIGKMNRAWVAEREALRSSTVVGGELRRHSLR